MIHTRRNKKVAQKVKTHVDIETDKSDIILFNLVNNPLYTPENDSH